MPIRGRTQRRIAWLGLLAIALLVVMPVLSRVANGPSTPSMGADCPEHMVGSVWPQTPNPSAPNDPLVHCGYCLLLGHTPLISSFAAPPLLLSIPEVSTHAATDMRPAPLAPLLAAHPRGPPSPITT